jgi:predicted NUDIX family phosphoesterase
MEHVLVVPTHLILSCLDPPRNGFHPGPSREILALVAERGFFTERSQAEVDPSLKQIIPYAVVVSGDEVFVFHRTREGAEARLHEKVSIGVGGHINPGDAPSGDVGGSVERAFERELHEELELESAYRREVVGVLNDDAEPVGQVHLGIVFRVELAEPRARVKEADNLVGGFLPCRAVSGHRDRMESWSRILQEHFWPRGRGA